MEDREELAELQALAVQDFGSALAAQGPAEAATVLRSYLVELESAPHGVLQQLAEAYAAAAAAFVSGGSRRSAQSLQPLLDLQDLLLQVAAPSAAAAAAVRGAWAQGAAALLYGAEAEAAAAALDRLERCAPMLSSLLAPGALEGVPAPASHAQTRSLLACALRLALLPPPGAPASAADALTGLALPPWFGRDAVHAEQLQAAAFEAFLAVVQHPAVARRLVSASASASGGGGGPAAAPTSGGAAPTCSPEAALRFLLLFRGQLPATVDSWWAHWATVLHALVAQAQTGGALALRRPAIAALLRCLCGAETAHMVVQVVLAHPSFQPDAGVAAAEAGAAGGRKRGGGGGRKAGGGKKGGAGGAGGGGTGGGGGRPKQALAMAASLLAHDVPSFLAGCCELLRPEASAPIGLRVEALQGECGAGGHPCLHSRCCYHLPPPHAPA